MFLGGLIRRSSDESREGVPVLGDLPGVGVLFANRSQKVTTTEIVVLITPKVMDFRDDAVNSRLVESTNNVEEKLNRAERQVIDQMDRVMGDGSSAPGFSPALEERSAKRSLENFQHLMSDM